MTKERDYRPLLGVMTPNFGVDLDMRAQIALDLLRSWGMVSAKDREDSQGRGALALMPVGEVVERACAMSERFFAAVDERGWVSDAAEPAQAAAVTGLLAAVQAAGRYDDGRLHGLMQQLREMTGPKGTGKP